MEVNYHSVRKRFELITPGTVEVNLRWQTDMIGTKSSESKHTDKTERSLCWFGAKPYLWGSRHESDLPCAMKRERTAGVSSNAMSKMPHEQWSR